jgi:hypothetical protein
MATQLISILVNNQAGGKAIRSAFLQDFSIIAVGHETDVLAFVFAVQMKSCALCQLTHFPLSEVAYGQADRGQLCLRKIEKDVALIFVEIDASSNHLSAILFLESGIVSGGDGLGIELPRKIQEVSELEHPVTHDARVRRSALIVFIDEIVNELAELMLKVDRVKRDAQVRRHKLGVSRIFDRAAAFSAFTPGMDSVPHEQSNHVVSLLLQETRSSAAVHPSAHGNDDTHWYSFYPN